MESKAVRTFRATVWTLSATAAIVDGDAALQRRIVTEKAETSEEFEAIIRDRFTWNVDDEVSFGPVSEVRS